MKIGFSYLFRCFQNISYSRIVSKLLVAASLGTQFQSSKCISRPIVSGLNLYTFIGTNILTWWIHLKYVSHVHLYCFSVYLSLWYFLSFFFYISKLNNVLSYQMEDDSILQFCLKLSKDLHNHEYSSEKKKFPRKLFSWWLFKTILVK